MMSSVPESDAAVTRGLFVSDDVLHVLNCGTMEAIGGILTTWNEIVRLRDLTSADLDYVRPPTNVSCNCGRFVAQQ